MPDTKNRRIQQRHGTYTDFQADQSNMLPDEIAVIDSGAPNYSGKAIAFKSLDGTIKLVKNTDDSVELADGQVTTDILDDGSVTEDKLAINSVKSRHIAPGQVTKAHIGSRAVRGNQIYLGTIEQENMDEDSVGEDQIIDGSVTTSKLSTAIKNQIDNAMKLLPVKTSLSDLSDLEIGQLFLYNNELLRKRTATRYEYIKSVYSTGGTGIDSYSPKYIGEFILFNNELYVGKNTSTGGYQQISTTLTVNLTGDLDGFTADRTVYAIYQAVKNKQSVIFSLSMYGGYHTYRFEVGQINSDSETGELLVRIYNSYLNSVGENWRFVASGRSGDTNNAVFSVITD